MSEYEWLEIFGDNLKEILEENDMTQGELAEATGLSRNAINDYVNKRKMPGVRALMNMSYELGIEFSDFIDFGSRIE